MIGMTREGLGTDMEGIIKPIKYFKSAVVLKPEEKEILLNILNDKVETLNELPAEIENFQKINLMKRIIKKIEGKR